MPQPALCPGAWGPAIAQNFVLGLLASFSAAEISALMAPRPHLSLAGTLDPLTPVDGLRNIDKAIQQAYAAVGDPAAWRQQTEAVGHVETPAMRQAVLRFPAQHVGSANAV